MADKLELMKRSFAMIKYSMPPRHGVTNVRVERSRERGAIACSQYLLYSAKIPLAFASALAPPLQEWQIGLLSSLPRD